MALDTTELFQLQPHCSRFYEQGFVASAPMNMPDDPGKAGLWTKAKRIERGLTAVDLAERISGLMREGGDPTTLSQQVVSKFEQGKNKLLPSWTRFIPQVLAASDSETKNDAHLTTALSDETVGITLLPTFAGMGSGGTGDDDAGVVMFSRDLIERELRAPPSELLAMVAEGNSMEPDFKGGDQILVDTRRKSLAQPGAFCLWDGDGHVIKFLEKLPDSDPPKVRVVSANSLYEAHERLLEEIHLIGRVVWFGRRVQ